MEFSARKRSRKSQSFKLIHADYHPEVYKIPDYSNDVNGNAKEIQTLYLGDESREIKKQITGMRRLLNDSVGRIYQRVGKEGEKLKEEVQDLDLAWTPRLNPPADTPGHLQPLQSSSWNELSPQTGHYSGQYGTRSKTSFQNQARTLGTNGEIPVANAASASSSSGSNCCTCNCQPALQAILQELKTMRKIMQIQAAAAQNRPQPLVPLATLQKSTVSRKRNKKKKVTPKTVEPLAVKQEPGPGKNSRKLPANLVDRLSVEAAEASVKTEPRFQDSASCSNPRLQIRDECALGDLVPITRRWGVRTFIWQGEKPLWSFAGDKPEVQLAEGFDVFMPKSQLDSILANYTRSGSLLFRKLVCAFFDDKTLANSLPNGKRKRGLNDNRKGLDQNIVGAIKVFTEKYCTVNQVDKLPGPRDWVQILQDQIKLARRRLKRGSAEMADGDEKLDISLLEAGTLLDATPSVPVFH